MTYVGRGLPQPTTVKKAIRWPVAISVDVSGSGFGHHAAEMRDVSRTGCLIELQCKFARNDFVMVTLPTFGPFGALVVWSDGLETGLKFQTAISLVVLEHIAGLHRRGGTVDF